MAVTSFRCYLSDFTRCPLKRPGFRRSEQKGIQVQADKSSTVPISLQIGATNETISVEANAELVETRAGALSKVISQQNIIELPLDGRNAAALVLLAPGTSDLNAGNARGQRRHDTDRQLSRCSVDQL